MVNVSNQVSCLMSRTNPWFGHFYHLWVVSLYLCCEEAGDLSPQCSVHVLYWCWLSSSCSYSSMVWMRTRFFGPGPFYKHGLTLSYYIHCKAWDEIPYYLSIPELNAATVDVWEWISNFNPSFTRHVITYSCWDKVLDLTPPPTNHVE